MEIKFSALCPRTTFTGDYGHTYVKLSKPVELVGPSQFTANAVDVNEGVLSEISPNRRVTESAGWPQGVSLVTIIGGGKALMLAMIYTLKWEYGGKNKINALKVGDPASLFFVES